MLVLVAIISFLIVIAVLVIAHELGHFITARARGVKVEEFGVGYPPRIFAIKRKGIVYSLNAIPLGGFTKMAGEEDPKIPGSLASKSIGTRLLVLSAGSLINLLLPIVLFAIAFMVPHSLVMGKVVIEDVAAGSPAARAGLTPGDSIVAINGRAVNNGGDLHRYIQLNLGSEITVRVQRDSAEREVRLTPRWQPPEGQGAVGIATNTTDAAVVKRSYPFWRAIPMGFTESIETYVLFKNGIISMIIGTSPVAVTGPVGIAQLTGEVAMAGISPLLEFAAFLSINLGIFNLFPLPALDGGRMAFVFVEWLRRGKRVPAKTEGLVHLIGFMLLIAFALAITYQDILRIIRGESLIP